MEPDEACAISCTYVTIKVYLKKRNCSAINLLFILICGRHADKLRNLRTYK